MTAGDCEKSPPTPEHKPFWPINFLLLSILTSLILSACGRIDLARDPAKESVRDAFPDAIRDGAVTVEKATPQLQVKILPADQVKKDKLNKSNNRAAPLKDMDAYTEWFYSCHAELDTEEQSKDDTIGASTLALKIKGIKFKLSLPITVYLPVHANAVLKEHEDGHVQICSIIYGRADSAAVEAAKQVVGKTFNGMGKDLPAARNMALAQAQRIIAQCYQEGTSTLADQASQKYELLCDQYAADPKMSRQTLAREACKRVLDIPVQVIK
jgi:hypothetical protein